MYMFASSMVLNLLIDLNIYNLICNLSIDNYSYIFYLHLLSVEKREIDPN